MSSETSASSAPSPGSRLFYTEDGGVVHTIRNCPGLSSSDHVLDAAGFFAIPGTRPFCSICESGAVTNDGYAALERAVIGSVPIELEHVPDQETQSIDARLLEDVVDRDYTDPSPIDPSIGSGILILESLSLTRGTAIEIKTCQKRVTDYSSSTGDRRGRWFIDPNAHERLRELEAPGAYLLVVIDGDDVLAALLVRARDLDDLVDERSTPTGSPTYHERLSAITWSNLIDPARIDSVSGGESLAEH